MNKLVGNAVVGQSGGPTAAINATLGGVIRGALSGADRNAAECDEFRRAENAACRRVVPRFARCVDCGAVLPESVRTAHHGRRDR